MKKLILLLMMPLLAAHDLALPGYRFVFPKDHFNHPNFRTEWWYYTGNLFTADGRRFGFELTFFRQGQETPEASAGPPVWQTRDVYLAHFALSDIGGKQFLYYERLNRPGPGLAGVDVNAQRIWNGNWQVTWNNDNQQLRAVSDSVSLELDLRPEKPPVINGKNGISQKAAGAGHASHYVSFTRIRTSGRLTLDGQAYTVSGLSWMDHEFFTEQLDQELAGWDWMSVQLDNGEDLMIYRLRRKDGGGDGFSSGTFIGRDGQSRYLAASDFRMTPLEAPAKTASGARYPLHWRLEIPSLSLNLDVSTPLPDQELVSKGIGPSYWEGAVDYRGTRQGQPVRGHGYLEMTGYDRVLRFQ